MTHYRIINYVDGALFKDETPDIIAYMEVRGHKLTGYNKNATNRQELQNQPKFNGFAGPMWDGDGIRYERKEAYNILSV